MLPEDNIQQDQVSGSLLCRSCDHAAALAAYVRHSIMPDISLSPAALPMVIPVSIYFPQDRPGAISVMERFAFIKSDKVFCP